MPIANRMKAIIILSHPPKDIPKIVAVVKN